MRRGSYLALGAVLFWALAGDVLAQSVSEMDPHVTVSEGRAPGAILLSWQPMANATGFTIRRRAARSEPWTQVAVLPSSATSWQDTTTYRGATWEYHVRRGDLQGAPGNAYVVAGFEVPFRDAPRDVLVVTDDRSAAALPERLDRLASDLEGDGWGVHRATVGRTAPPPEVKAVIAEAHARSGGRLRAVLLLGEVPRAFSGAVGIDGHPDHHGAWPADGYYADLTGQWTDTMNLGGAEGFTNVSGDGKFDQSTLPAPLTIAVGRVDTADLPAFAPLDAQDLLARYLDANHAWRHGALQIPRRTLVVDTFGYFGGEAFARVAWRAGVPAFGAPPEEAMGFFDALETSGGYALAFGSGGGAPDGASGVGTTADFVSRTPRAAFMGLFGSYFGDWSYPDNFLRASLISPGATLAAAWFGRPYLHLHGLGALESFGEAFLATANNGGAEYDAGFGARGVHQALLGDPTLRLFVTAPPTGAAAAVETGQVVVTWAPSAQATHGYHVYRKRADVLGPEVRLTEAPVAATRWEDSTIEAGTAYVYRVVAVELIATGSGTFFNHSQGALVRAVIPGGEGPDAGVMVPPDAGTSAGGPDAGPVEGSAGAPPGGCGCGAGTGAASWLAVVVVILAAHSRLGRRATGR